MKICPECNWHYPQRYLVPMYITGLGYTEPICAICALDITGEALGVTLNAFKGEVAQRMLELAKLWRNEHPEFNGNKK